MPEGRPPLWDRDWGPGGPRRHCPQEGLHPAPHEDTSDVWAAHSGTGEGCGLSLRLTLKDWNMQYIISTYDQKWYWFSNNDVESKYVGGLIKLACSKWHFQIVYKYSGDGLTKSHYLNQNDVHCRTYASLGPLPLGLRSHCWNIPAANSPISVATHSILFLKPSLWSSIKKFGHTNGFFFISGSPLTGKATTVRISNRWLNTIGYRKTNQT